MEEAGSVKLTCVVNCFRKQLHHLIRTEKKHYAEVHQAREAACKCKLSIGSIFSPVSGSATFTDLVIGDEGNTVVDSHSADEEVILQVTSVVIGQVDHQVDMTPVDQSIKHTKNCVSDHYHSRKIKPLKARHAIFSTDVESQPVIDEEIYPKI